MHLLALKRNPFPEFQLLRKNCKYRVIIQKQHLYLQQASSSVLNAQIPASLGRITIKTIIVLHKKEHITDEWLTLAACLHRKGRKPSVICSSPMLASSTISV